MRLKFAAFTLHFYVVTVLRKSPFKFGTIYAGLLITAANTRTASYGQLAGDQYLLVFVGLSI